MAQYKEDTILFRKNNTVILYVNQMIYDRLERIGREHYRDNRRREGLIRAYAVIRLHEIISMTNRPVPVDSKLLADVISKRYYAEYLALLEQELLVLINRFPLEYYSDKTGKKCVKQNTTTYRTLDFSYDILGTCKIFPVKLSINSVDYNAIMIKANYIKDHYKEDEYNEKRIFAISCKNDEIILVKQIVNCIKSFYSKRDNYSLDTIIYSKIKRKLDNKKEEEIRSLIKRLIERLVYREREEEIIESNYNKEQIVKNNPGECVDYKDVAELSYYNELGFDLQALDECICMRDLRDLANINKIPEIAKDGKIYSTFARIRRPVRKHICFRGHRLVEASDIRCAHFTMLPKIFEMYGVDIPANEMMRWNELTQHGDLYKEAVAGTTVTRAQIKPTFQSFFSLKNEQSYIHGGIDRDSENRQILCRWFSRNFPHIYQALMDWHKYQPVTVKRAANRVESDIMNPICDDLRSIGLHPFRLHDAIYLPEDDAACIPFDINQRVYDYINGTSAERVAV